MEAELKLIMECALLDLVEEKDLDFAVECFLAEGKEERRFRSSKGLLELEAMPEEEVLNNFRFAKEDLHQLVTNLKIPDVVEPRRGCRVGGLTALCILLRRLSYPNRYTDLEVMFGLSAPVLCNIYNYVVKMIEEKHGHLLSDFRSLKYLDNQKLDEFCDAVRNKGAPLNTCWGFIDGTARRICRPTFHQEQYYSGHKRHHCVKYQSILTPDGIIASLHGAYVGRRHDAGIFRESGIYHQLKTIGQAPNSHQYVIYGDPAYALSDVVISPYKGARISCEQQEFNRRMSKVRQAVEWGFGKVVAQFAFCDFHKNQKLLLQEVEVTYKTAVILDNCHTCLYGSQTGEYFGLIPPSLDTYLQ